MRSVGCGQLQQIVVLAASLRAKSSKLGLVIEVIAVCIDSEVVRGKEEKKSGTVLKVSRGQRKLRLSFLPQTGRSAQVELLLLFTTLMLNCK